MSKAWIPSVLGRHFTRSATWHLELNGVELTLTVSGRVHKVNVAEEETYRIQSGLLWTDIGFYTEQELEVRVNGLPNVRGVDLKQALNSALAEKRLREDAIYIETLLELIDRWLAEKAKQEKACVQERRWFTYEQQMALLSIRPNVDSKAIAHQVSRCCSYR